MTHEVLTHRSAGMRTLVLLICVLGWAGAAEAQTMQDYTSTPPFISNTVPPNVLLLMDNSGSMNSAAYQTPFSTGVTYFGYFDPYECYTYSANKFQPDPASNPSAPGTCGSSYPWSGNLLNYVSMRRIDIVKWVMVGGVCTAGGRDAQNNCKELVGQYTFDANACCRDQTVAVTTAQATGRMPSTYIPSGSSSDGNVYFHLMGSIGTLKGGFCVDNDPGQPNAQCDDDGGSYVETLWQIRVVLLENATGIIQQVGSRARFGLMEFKSGSGTAGDGGKVLSDVGGNLQDILTAVENTTPATWTPLAEALYEATRYFAQIPPTYTNSDYSYNVTTRDPYYFKQPDWASTSQYVPCCKSFVIVFTDGQPTKDTNIPTSLQDYAHTAASHQPVGFTGHCTGAAGCTGPHNQSPHSTHGGGLTNHNTQSDHHDNCSAFYGGVSGDSCANNGAHYLDDVAYYAHTTDLRQATLPVLGETGKDLPGLQSLTVYTFYAFGNGGNLLQSASKTGGFEDRNGNNMPDLLEEYDRVNNNTGAAGADGIPDTYFESDDAFKLKERLLAAITSILQKSASGTSVSVLATSSTGDGSLYQAFFYPTTFEGLNEVKWTGYTQALFLDPFGNIREDTDGDGKLVLNRDYIIKTRYDTATADVKVDRYKDLDSNGIADTTTPFETVGLKEVKSIWEAGKRLALMNASDRKILTWADKNGNGLVDATEQMTFHTDNAATLAPYLRASTDPWTANNIINFIRGEQVTGLRNRQLTVSDGVTSTLKVWKLGDPIHSTPTIVGPPKERYDVIYGDASYTNFFVKYKNRRQVAYVGANDGMLHAFNTGFYHRGDDLSTSNDTEHGWFTRTPTDNGSGSLLGQELWAFIPYQLLPHLLWLTRPDYTHVYYVDLKPKVTDVRIFTPDDDHPNGWGTILIGGFRLGGSCGVCAAGTGAPPMQVTANFGSGNETRTFYTAYFVLDITNPEKDPVMLWSFSLSELGLSTSYPAVVRLNPPGSAKTDNAQAKWMMLVGSGPTGYDGISTQVGKMFAVDLKTGPIDPYSGLAAYATFSTSDANSFMGNVASLDADLDFKGEVAYLGNTINNGTNPTWVGKLYRLTTASGATTTSSWGVASGSNRIPTLLLGSFPLAGTLKVGPVTVEPTVAVDDSNKLWVYFGTGRFWAVSEKTGTDQQYFFGVKDFVMTGGCVQSDATNCEMKNLLNVSSATVCVTCATGTNQVTGVTGVTTFEGTSDTSLQGLVQSMQGWYTTLPAAGERVVSSPTLIGGIVYFSSFIPSTDICSGSGTGNLYALFYKTGTAYKESVIGTSTAGSNTNALRSMALGTAGLASQMAVHIGAQGTGANGTTSNTGCSGRITGFIQSSTGTLSQFCTKPPLNPWSHYVSWLNQRE